MLAQVAFTGAERGGRHVGIEGHVRRHLAIAADAERHIDLAEVGGVQFHTELRRTLGVALVDLDAERVDVVDGGLRHQACGRGLRCGGEAIAVGVARRRRADQRETGRCGGDRRAGDFGAVFSRSGGGLARGGLGLNLDRLVLRQSLNRLGLNRLTLDRLALNRLRRLRRRHGSPGRRHIGLTIGARHRRGGGCVRAGSIRTGGRCRVQQAGEFRCG